MFQVPDRTQFLLTKYRYQPNVLKARGLTGEVGGPQFHFNSLISRAGSLSSSRTR
jgi:hypothetical protein